MAGVWGWCHTSGFLAGRRSFSTCLAPGAARGYGWPRADANIGSGGRSDTTQRQTRRTSGRSISAMSTGDRHRRLSLSRIAIGLVAAASAGAGCSGSLGFGRSSENGFTTAGEELIEGELADGIGLGPLDADCSGRELSAGDTFECSATPNGQGTIRFIATINEQGDQVNISSTNLLLAEQVEEIESFAASLIEEQTGSPIGAENFECADRSLIISSGETIDCLVTDPSDGTVYGATVTVEDVAQPSVRVQLGDPIR